MLESSGDGSPAVVYEACYVASVPGIYEPVEGSWLRNGRLSGNHHRYYKTYYEAAGIDGATIWQQIRYITLPLMKTVIIMMFIMAVGRTFLL